MKKHLTQLLISFCIKILSKNTLNPKAQDFIFKMYEDSIRKKAPFIEYSEIVRVKKGKIRYELVFIRTSLTTHRFNIGRHHSSFDSFLIENNS